MDSTSKPQKSFSQAMSDAWKAAQSGRSPMEAHFGVASPNDQTLRRRFESLNAAGRFLYFLLGVAVIYVGETKTMPYVYGSDYELLAQRQLLGYYLFFNTLLNCILIILKVSIYKPDELPTVSPRERWKFCDLCKIHTPNRAHHCPLCFACILRRDHHCFFAGVCISHDNQRYFVVALTYALVGGLYSLWLTDKYISGKYRALFSWDWYYFLPPVMLYDSIFGEATLGIILMCILQFFTFSSTLAAAYYLSMQVILIARNQTLHEYGKGIVTYRRGLRHNIESVFGPICLVPFYFIFPVVYCVKPKGNGIEFENRDGKKV